MRISRYLLCIYVERGIALNLLQFFVSFVLYFVIFFGISFILNMLLRRTWLMTFLYPIVILLIISDNRLSDYFIKTGTAFSALGETIMTIAISDYLVLSGGLIGTIVSGIVIKMLRKSGYQMF